MPRILILLVLVLHSSWPMVETSCDRVFVPNSSKNETFETEFEAPNRVNSRPFKIFRNEQGNLLMNTNDTQEDYKSLHCIYKFIAGENERVVLSFDTFKLRGDEPECNNEYVDIFVRIKPEDNLESVIGSDRPNGRFCTTIKPRKIVSLNNMLVLVIYSNLRPPTNKKPMFTGTYEFIKAKSNDQIGPSAKGTLCTHTVYSSDKREGEFSSVTYPGVYVKGLRCTYKFIGEPKQRVRLEFLDLDLYSGGSHCPFDSIKVFDGLEETDPVINTICGSHRSLIIFSTHENLLVTFTTLQREAEVQNRGFSGYFEFSDKFVDTNFILGINAKHIRGSECDQRIISNKGTTGSIISPDHKHHQNAICRYIFEGLQTSLDYEKVMLKFIDFDLKTSRASGAHSTTTTTTTSTTTTTPTPIFVPNLLLFGNQSSSSTSTSNQDSSLSGSSNSSQEQCPDNYVRLYTGEQKADQKQDPNDYDYVYCGNDIPQGIESDAASLLMEYNSGSIGGYFKAEYAFVVDFRIPGTQASSGCNYIYRSDYLKTGVFNSPRYPSWYINDINCSYTLLTKNDEALLLQFSTFKMANSFNEKVLGYNETCKGQDLVEIVELILDHADQRVIQQTDLGIYCGTTTPGPILSFRPIRLNFQTNKEHVHYGFAAYFTFYRIADLKNDDFVTNCGGQIYANQRFRSGTLLSPETYRPETYEKRNHICTWNITARPGHRVALDFSKFELEGSPVARGCGTASVRLSLDRSKLPIEICGTLAPANGTTHQFMSENESLTMTFISTKYASGSNGFIATWIEIKRSL